MNIMKGLLIPVHIRAGLFIMKIELKESKLMSLINQIISIQLIPKIFIEKESPKSVSLHCVVPDTCSCHLVFFRATSVWTMARDSKFESLNPMRPRINFILIHYSSELRVWSLETIDASNTLCFGSRFLYMKCDHLAVAGGKHFFPFWRL